MVMIYNTPEDLNQVFSFVPSPPISMLESVQAEANNKSKSKSVCRFNIEIGGKGSMEQNKNLV